MKTFLLSLVTFATLASGQDCVYPFNFGQAAPFNYSDNRQSACTYWQLSYQSSGFSVVSLQFEYASGSNSPGAFAVFNGTTVTGSNPMTSTAGGASSFQGYVGWYRINAITLTGTGSLTGALYGWKYQPVSAATSGNTTSPATGPYSISAVGALIPPQPANFTVEKNYGGNSNCWVQTNNGYAATGRTNAGQFQSMQFWILQTNTSGCSNASGVLMVCDTNTPLPASYPWTVIVGLALVQSTPAAQFGLALAKVGSATFEAVPFQINSNAGQFLAGKYGVSWNTAFGTSGSALPVSAGSVAVPYPYIWYVVHDNGTKRCWAESSYNPGSIYGMPIAQGEVSGWCTGSGSSGVVDGYYVGQANVTSNFVPDHLCVYAESESGSYGFGFNLLSEQILGQ